MSDISEVQKLSHSELRKVYEAKENVLRFCKEKLGSNATNEQAAIMHAYELQAGSYINKMAEDPAYRAEKEQYGKAIAEIIAAYAPASILEAGVGEATTLAEVVKNLPADMAQSIYAFDLSWSRVLMARRYFEQKTGRSGGDFFTGELEHIALPDNSFDVVLTSHAVEPNHGREKEILHELYRVTAGHLIMFEPAYELAEPAARERMEYHGYCRGLKDIALAAGWNVVRCELFGVRKDTANPSMILVIEKGQGTKAPAEKHFVSPIGGGALIAHGGHYFNEEEGLVFPVLNGVPYLTRSAALLASHFLES
ncbi:MAG: class I SAM-dependent methyltransferase [Cyanobacteria bacterium SZAS LIN-2]|nr:class I SAM-dependent methyltransferase [Cyanobacteria bacterium SZAS LIN-2]